MREGRRTVVKARDVTFALTTNPQPTFEIVQVESKGPSAALEAGSSKESVEQDTSRIFGTQTTSFFHVFSVTQPGL